MGDFAEGVVGEEGLMAGDEDIGKGEETGELVVLENLRGAVFKEEARLLFVDIDGQVADVTLFDALRKKPYSDSRLYLLLLEKRA